jgi:SAM-dependent methyltransferase
METIFGDIYSKYYNLLYNKKDYAKEFNYITSIINIYYPSQKGHKNPTILDIGCGTGKHLKLFKDTGYTVFGIDLSENMLATAQKHLNQKKNLVCSSASNFKFHTKFDVIISLFHVMSYQTGIGDLEKVFENIKNHLADNGIFIFDFWYGPAVLSDPPVVRIKRLENEKIRLTRIAEPRIYYNDNIVDVKYEMILEDKDTHIIEKINEIHKMRYLFLPEIKKIAADTDFAFINSYHWLSLSPLSEKSWYGLAVLGHASRT